MIYVSELLESIINSHSRTFKVKLVSDGREYGDIFSLKYSQGLPSEIMSVGNAISALAECEVAGIPDAAEGAKIKAFISAEGAENEEIPLGVFYAQKPQVQQGVASLTLYDSMAKAEKTTYESTLAKAVPHTAEEYFEDICRLLGEECEPISGDKAYAFISEDKLSGYSCRNALSYLAAFIGCNCIVNRNGLFEMRGFKKTEYTIDADTVSEPEFADGEEVISFLSCYTDSETALQYGTGVKGLELISPVMTQNQLNLIGAELCGKTYKSVKISQLLGNPALEIGDVITLDYDGMHTVPITYISFDFDGGLSAEIESYPLGDMYSVSLEERLDFITREMFKSVSKQAQNTADFSSAIGKALGLYETRISTGNGVITYFHDKQTLGESSYIFCLTSEGFAFADSWGGSHADTLWHYGIGKDGNAILKMLSLYKLTAEVIEAGILKSTDGSTEFNLDEGSITTKKVYDEGSIVTEIAKGVVSITQDFIPDDFTFEFIPPENYYEMSTAEQIACRINQYAEKLMEYTISFVAGYHVKNTAKNTSAHLSSDKVSFNLTAENEQYEAHFGIDGSTIYGESKAVGFTILYQDSDGKIKEKSIFDAIYPVGSIYMSASDVNPSALFGGTWEPWGSGRVPVGVSSDDDDFSLAEATGGEKAHTLTLSEMPKHTHNPLTTNSDYPATSFLQGHSINRKKVAINPSSADETRYAFVGANEELNNLVYGSTTDTAGGGTAHNNMPPYITCYMFKRIA